MKNNWQTKKLGEVCEVVGGGTPKTSDTKYWNGEIVWVTPKDMGQIKNYIIYDSLKKISNAGLARSSAKLLPEGSVILSSRAPIGYVAIAGTELATNQGCRNFICSPEIYNKFLYYFLVDNKVLLNKLGGGSTFKEVSGTKLKGIKISFPEFEEQKRIVKILDEVFEGIEKAKKNTQKNLQNAKELFESYLQSVFAHPGDDWEVCLLNDYVKFIDYRGRTPKKTKSGLRLITAKNIKMGYLQREPEEFINPKDYEGWMTRGIPNIGDVLFTTEAPLGNVAQLDTNDKVAFAQRTIIFQPDRTKLEQTFLKYLVLSPQFQKNIREKGTGATVKGIKSSLLKKIPIFFPLLADQKSIVAKLDALSEQTKKLESIYQQKLNALEELKKSVLASAFAGKL